MWTTPWVRITRTVTNRCPRIQCTASRSCIPLLPAGSCHLRLPAAPSRAPSAFPCRTTGRLPTNHFHVAAKIFACFLAPDATPPFTGREIPRALLTTNPELSRHHDHEDLALGIQLVLLLSLPPPNNPTRSRLRHHEACDYLQPPRFLTPPTRQHSFTKYHAPLSVATACVCVGTCLSTVVLFNASLSLTTTLSPPDVQYPLRLHVVHPPALGIPHLQSFIYLYTHNIVTSRTQHIRTSITRLSIV